MTKEEEKKALEKLFSQDTYFADDLSEESFQKMMNNIDDDHPIFMNVIPNSMQNAVVNFEKALNKKDKNLTAVLEERDEAERKQKVLADQLYQINKKANDLLCDKWYLQDQLDVMRQALRNLLCGKDNAEFEARLIAYDHEHIPFGSYRNIFNSLFDQSRVNKTNTLED